MTKSPIKWLLITHGLPAKPAYLRVKVGRLLREIGAVPIKNSVYALPLSADNTAACVKVANEISAAGGDAVVCEASLLAGLDDVRMRALFDAARDADYEDLAQQGRGLLALREISEIDVRRLRRRREEIVAIDFFAAHGRQLVEGVLDQLDRKLQKHPDVRRKDSPPKLNLRDLRNRMWVTRRHIHVDRIASAWLIRRFIDPGAEFKFVDGRSYTPKPRELRFDMADAEFTHEGSNCTFETLVARANLGTDRALKALAEVIHDLDVDEGKFGRPETAGLKAMIAGICAKSSDDNERLKLGAEGMDQFYAYFQNE